MKIEIHHQILDLDDSGVSMIEHIKWVSAPLLLFMAKERIRQAKNPSCGLLESFYPSSEELLMEINEDIPSEIEEDQNLVRLCTFATVITGLFSWDRCLQTTGVDLSLLHGLTRCSSIAEKQSIYKELSGIEPPNKIISHLMEHGSKSRLLDDMRSFAERRSNPQPSTLIPMLRKTDTDCTFIPV